MLVVAVSQIMVNLVIDNWLSSVTFVAVPFIDLRVAMQLHLFG